MAAKCINKRSYLSLSVEQLRGRLEEKGLPTTGKEKVLLERLVNAQYVLQCNVDVKPELQARISLRFRKSLLDRLIRNKPRK